MTVPLEPSIDTVHRVQTPEGVELLLCVAGPAARCLAWLIDAGVQAVLLGALLLLCAQLGWFGTGVWLIAIFLISWFYPVAYEVLARGRTPGKRMLGLQVVHEDGTPVTWSSSLLRNFLRVVDLLPAAYLLGLGSMCCSPGFRRIGDWAAGTLVIHAEGRRPAAVPAAAGPGVAPLRPPLALSPEEQRAVLAFAERAPRLTEERARELAAIPEPLLRGEEPRRALERIAAFLLGRGSGGAPDARAPQTRPDPGAAAPGADAP